MILSEPLSDGISFLEILHKIGYIPNAVSSGGSPRGASLPRPQDILQLPPPGSHSVLIVKKILLLGVYIQSIQLHTKYHDTMARMVEAAICVLATRDELTSSLEGIECITLECLYHEGAGNLRRAWLAIRRAMAMAQIIGLHHGSATSIWLEAPEPETRERVDSEHMWLRVMQIDRYISLMLGLSHSLPESLLAHPESMERCSPIERMRRLDAVAGPPILSPDLGQGICGPPKRRWLLLGQARLPSPLHDSGSVATDWR
ncbi:hypothetical protein AUP68_10861 [Ilyonectria robusta]